MYNKAPQAASQPSNFNYDDHADDLVERFGRLIKQLGPVSKRGTLRYNFEVDFMYALNEIKNGPPYLQGKLFDKAGSIVAALGNQLRLQQKPVDE